MDYYKNVHADTFPMCLNQDTGLQSKVKDFYKVEFWDRVRGDDITEQDIAEETFDTAINMGVKYGVKFLQQALNILNRNESDYPDLVDDGIMGSKTLGALSTYLDRDMNRDRAVRMVVFWQNAYQALRYIEIMERDPTQEIFVRGWAKRVGFSPIEEQLRPIPGPENIIQTEGQDPSGIVQPGQVPEKKSWWRRLFS